MFQGPISLAFTDLKPKDVLDSATERSKKERGREGLSSTFASKGRGLNRSMLRMKATESYISKAAVLVKSFIMGQSIVKSVANLACFVAKNWWYNS